MANRNFARSMRRKTQWGGFGNQTGAAVLPTVRDLAVATPLIISQAIIVGGAAGFIEEEVTITRTIANIQIGVGVATAEASATVAIGCGVFRQEAIAAGVGSLPSPEDDPDFEWLYYGVWTLKNGVTSQVGFGLSSWQQIALDVRGQRILRSGQSVAWIAESQANDAFAGVGGRYLVKLT